jgi:aspartyl-tRNA(Asn)/glutamyl-tRNA(Gln) amidotransferase subunit A
MAYLALGSDTGGSIRQPGALCGVVGFKPSYGRVSRYGLVAFASSLDQIGPIGRTVSDVALLTKVISRYDPRDSTCVNRDVPDYLASLDAGVEGRKVGIPREYFGQGLDAGTESAVRAAIEALGGLGAEIVEISLPHTEYAVAAYYLIATAEASSNLARYDGVHYGHRPAKAENIVELFSKAREEGFGPEVKRRVMLGTYVLSAGYYDAYYLKASKVRSLVKSDFDKAFEEVDFIVCPTSPSPAFKIGEKVDDPLKLYLCDIYTIPANLAGLPGISIPCGLSVEGLPIGVQVMGRPFDEEGVLQAARALESVLDFEPRRPPLVTRRVGS